MALIRQCDRCGDTHPDMSGAAQRVRPLKFDNADGINTANVRA
jgi:hypothetical protein